MAERPAKIGICGTFDVRNFGDVLFPLIAAMRLEPAGFTVEAFSPTDADTGWTDAVRPVAIAGLPERMPALAALMIGGGNIVHNRGANLAEYGDPDFQRAAYASLWLGATLAGALSSVPVVWNAPGVPVAFEADALPLVGAALASARYVAVRDDESAAFLGKGNRRLISVVPDTALDIARLWPPDSLREVFERMLASRGADPSRRHLAIHLKTRSLSGPVDRLGAEIRQFCAARDLVPLLVAIGPCHGDDAAARALAEAIGPDAVDLSAAAGLREIAAAVAWSAGYVGASMHGYVAAAAYGVPGVIVGSPRLPKMAGLLRHLGRPEDEAPDWSSALDRAGAQLSRPSQGRRALPPAVAASLDAHWAKISALAARPRARTPSRRSARFVSTLLTRGLDRQGWGWVLAPFLHDAQRASERVPARGNKVDTDPKQTAALAPADGTADLGGSTGTGNADGLLAMTDDVTRVFGSLDDLAWAKTIVRSIREPEIDGVRFPGFPDATTQARFVGNSAEVALAEPGRFYVDVKAFCATQARALAKGGRVLDFGVGWGRIIRYFWRDVGADGLFGVDVDPEILEVCRQTGVPGNLVHVRPEAPLPFPDGHFDLVTAFSVFTHLSEGAHRHWLDEIARVLKPGGAFVPTVEPRRFLSYIAAIPPDDPSTWKRALRAHAGEVEQLIAAFDRGEYVYLPTGGGKFRDASFYGDAVVPPDYIRSRWTAFDLRSYIDDPGRFWQAVAFLTRR